MPDRPINPFIVGAPASTLKFIGRRDQVSTILSQLANPESRGSSAVIGERRIGKTSLLHYIASPEAAMRYNLPTDQFVFVPMDGHTLDNYVNSLDLQTFTGDVFWHYVAQYLAYSPQRASLLALMDHIPGFKRLTRTLEGFVPLHRQDKIGIFDLINLSEQIATDNKLIVLLLDEFEWIINNTDPQRPSLLNTLRSLINLPIGRRGFALITSSAEPLNVLCRKREIKFTGSPFYNMLVPVHLGPFSPAEARELIDAYLEGAAITFNDKDKDFVCELSEGYPYWLQRTCFKLFDCYLEKVESDSVQATQIAITLDALDYEETMTEIMVEKEGTTIPPTRRKKRKEPTKSERLAPPSKHQLANLIRTRHETGNQPYILLLGSSLSLAPEVRHAVCKSDDWEVFWTDIQHLSVDERYALMASSLAGLNLDSGYRCLAKLSQAGYFNVILTANIDDALDNALHILKANEFTVLCHGQTSTQEITAALSRLVPRVKVIKLRGDINAYKLPLTPGGQFEFPATLEEAIEQLLSRDTILVGDIPYDTDIQRCIHKGDGALWVVVPEKPRPGSFLYNAKQARPKGKVITGPGAEFGPFFRTLAETLGLKTVPPNDPGVL